MQEKTQLLRKALMDYLVIISAQDPAVLVCVMQQLLLQKYYYFVQYSICAFCCRLLPGLCQYCQGWW